MHEQPSPTPPQSSHPITDAAAATPHASAGDDVLKAIADVEGHLTRLRSAQKQQNDAISSLTARSKALHVAEEELARQRHTLTDQQAQIERDRASLQVDRDRFADQCRRMDAELQRRAKDNEQSHQRIEHDRAEMASQIDQAKRGTAELEKAKGVWQAHVEQVEARLEQAQRELDAKQEACSNANDALAAAKSQWEKQRQDAQAALEARSRELDEQVADLAEREETLTHERQQLAADREQALHEREAIQARAAALEAERNELVNRVEQAERNVGELIEQVEKTEQELASRTHAHKQAIDNIAQMQKHQKSLEQAAEAAKAHVAKVEEESHELLRLADSERTEMQSKLQAKLDAARTEFENAREARDAAMAELESARKKCASMQHDLKSRDDALATKDSQYADLQHKLDLASGKLNEFAQILSEQTPQLERGASALAMCEEQAEQIDRLTGQLAELQLASDPEEIRRRDARITELTDALRQARGQCGGDVSVAEIEQRNATLEQELQEARLEAQNATIAAEEAQKQLQAYLDDGAEAQVQGVAIAEHAAKIAALTAELDRQKAASAKDLEQRLSAQTSKHQNELATAREHEHVAATLRKQIAELEAKLAHAKAKPAATPSANNEADSEYVSRLKAKAEQITVVADHLRRRRARLEKLRRLMDARRIAAPNAGTAANSQMRSEQAAQLERERQHLLEVRKMLAQSEFTMIRRWARQRAVYAVIGVMFVAAVSAAGTWFGVNHFFPAVRSASLVLEARQRPGGPALTDEQKQEWTNWHADIAADPSFQQTLAKRMAERQIHEWARPESIAARMSQDFAIDSSRSGVVMYNMTGEKPQQLCDFLDIFAHTVLTESARQGGRRIDGAMTTATGERKVDGRACYASLNPVPVRDERMQYALPIFGGVLGALLLLTMMTYVKLSRSKRVFEDENGSLFQDMRPTAAA